MHIQWYVWNWSHLILDEDNDRKWYISQVIILAE